MVLGGIYCVEVCCGFMFSSFIYSSPPHFLITLWSVSPHLTFSLLCLSPHLTFSLLCLPPLSPPSDLLPPSPYSVSPSLSRLPFSVSHYCPLQEVAKELVKQVCVYLGGFAIDCRYIVNTFWDELYQNVIKAMWVR